jgi:hypothetical protein
MQVNIRSSKENMDVIWQLLFVRKIYKNNWSLRINFKKNMKFNYKKVKIIQ